MPRKQSLIDIRSLSPAERIQIVEEIWDSLLDFPDAIPLTTAQKKDLDRRLSNHARSPEAAVPWPTVRSRILRRKR